MAAVGMTRVEAANAAAAEALVLDHHPDRRVHAVDSALVTWRTVFECFGRGYARLAKWNS